MSRTETDLLGPVQVPDDALWGAHTQRAIDNFPPSYRRLPRLLIRAFALVKRAAAVVNHNLGHLPKDVADALIAACDELYDGNLDHHMVVDPLAGGAGTSLNMNVNEVLANRANELLGAARGSYHPVHPLDTVNRHQSTNDVFPTALRIAALWELQRLESHLVDLQAALQEKEQQYSDVVMVGRTQLQDAVPVTAGQMFSTWAEAVARDRWRVFKSIERLKVVNIGGTAVGTGVGAPRNYIFKIIEELRNQSHLPLARAENPVEATANQDAVVEVDGIISAMAANLGKIAGDLRILSMAPVREIILPPRQAGSSIMPGKVNPVIPEYVAQIAGEIMAGHGALTMAAAGGNLQLSQYFPVIAWHLLDHLRLAANGVQSLSQRCIRDLKVDAEQCAAHLGRSMAIAAALVPAVGYEKVQAAVVAAKEGDIPITRALLDQGIDQSRIDEALNPARLRRLGD